jgi:DNA topoisomerase-1
VVTDKLIQAFPDILDVKFTAGMELKLDEVEENHADWVKLLRDFYGPFHATVAGSLEKIEHAGGAISPYPCPKCGKPLLYRISKNGFFLACSDRECATTGAGRRPGQADDAGEERVHLPEVRAGDDEAERAGSASSSAAPGTR